MYYRQPPYLGKAKSVLDYDFFRYYKSKSEHRNLKNIYRFNDLSKVVKDFWGIVEDHMLNNSGGVFIDKFGYFCITMNPKKSVSIGRNRKKYLDSHTKTRNFFLTFISSTKDPVFNSFSMDRAFSRKVKKKLVEKLKKGKKYYNYFPELTQVLKDRNYIK